MFTPNYFLIKNFCQELLVVLVLDDVVAVVAADVVLVVATYVLAFLLLGLKNFTQVDEITVGAGVLTVLAGTGVGAG